MNVSDVQPQFHSTAKEPLPSGSKRESVALYMALSAAVHGVVILGMLGSAWLWGRAAYYKQLSYTVSLVDAPLTLRQPTHAGGGEPPPGKSATAGDQPAAVSAETATKPTPVEQPPAAAVKPTPVEQPPAPVQVIPAAPVPKATPPAAKATPAPQEKKPEPRELKKPELAEPKKPTPEEPKKPAVSPPPRPAASPPSQPLPSATATEARQTIDKLRERQAQAQPPAPATATEARQAVDKLRERQAQEAKAQAEVAQAQQRAAEERLAALRARYSSIGTGGGTGGGGTGRGGTGGGATGLATDLRGIRMQAYQEWVYELIRTAWILPMPQEEARKLQATALLLVRRDGQVTRFQLLKPSGNPMFDESLLRAIKQADPLPPLPEDYQGESLEVELRFRTREP